MSHRNRAIYSPNALTIFSDPLFQKWSASFEAELIDTLKHCDIVVASVTKATAYLYGAALENVIDTMDEGDGWKEYGIYSLLYGNLYSVMADITVMLPSGTWYDRRDREVETTDFCPHCYTFGLHTLTVTDKDAPDYGCVDYGDTEKVCGNFCAECFGALTDGEDAADMFPHAGLEVTP
jgi:hypothetical protein